MSRGKKVIFLYSKYVLSRKDMEQIRRNVLSQLPSGVVSIPENIEYQVIEFEDDAEVITENGSI
ncbi:MAG: hypothetical protein KH056_00775 [Clostridiales bacterium]|nr:hypothetical protein [Clostridiales bacterium]DAV20449.1 MAG TPA: PUA Pre-PUA-like domain [Caudoviricetes sp.]